jgi:hypothetical protein
MEFDRPYRVLRMHDKLREAREHCTVPALRAIYDDALQATSALGEALIQLTDHFDRREALDAMASFEAARKAVQASAAVEQAALRVAAAVDDDERRTAVQMAQAAAVEARASADRLGTVIEVLQGRQPVETVRDLHRAIDDAFRALSSRARRDVAAGATVSAAGKVADVGLVVGDAASGGAKAAGDIGIGVSDLIDDALAHPLAADAEHQAYYERLARFSVDLATCTAHAHRLLGV